MARSLVLGPQTNCPTSVGTASSFMQFCCSPLQQQRSIQLITILDENYQGIGSMICQQVLLNTLKKHKDMILAGSSNQRQPK